MQELPLACTLDSEQAEQRSERWRRVSSRALIESSFADGITRLRYRADDGVGMELRELVELERVCCAFLDFKLREPNGELLLEVSGPPESVTIVAGFAESAAALSRPS